MAVAATRAVAAVLVYAVVTAPLYLPAGTPAQQIPERDDRIVRVLASTGQRLAARAIDFLVAFTVVLAAISPVYAVALLSDASSSSSVILWVAVPAAFIGMASPFLLRAGTIARWGCTLGQRVAGIRVVRQEDGLRPPGWRRSFRRYVLPRSSSSFALFTDPWEHRNDERLGQCMHDRRAGTVVVQAQAPPAPEESGGLAVLRSSGAAVPSDHVRRWERRERGRRVALGSAVGVLAAAILVTPVVLALGPSGRSSVGDPAFEVNTFYDDIHFENAFGGRSATYDRTAAEVLDSEKGCLAGAMSEQARGVLREAECEGRIEIAFRSTEGVLVSSHVLRFPDAAAARIAERGLQHTDLRFVPGGPTDPPGGARIGQVGSTDRYVVATTAVSPAQPDAAAKAKNAFTFIHVPTLNTILWL
ncbi:RDD family protein [Actinomadura latina]|uniref:RDD family protein n=1 Tax=Actinomadura latina TaxID=163603 RepID=UPI000B3274AD|nr:RDD family protein [Actinomadura latina]